MSRHRSRRTAAASTFVLAAFLAGAMPAAHVAAENGGDSFRYVVPPKPGSAAMRTRPIPRPPGPPPWARGPATGDGALAAPAENLAPDSTGYPTVGTIRSVVQAIDFIDNRATTKLSHYDDMLFDTAGYPDAVTKSMRGYYREASYGQLTVDGDVYGKARSDPAGTVSWIRAPQRYRYYVAGDHGFGTYPRNAQKLAEDAVRAADPYVNFAEFATYEGSEAGQQATYVASLFVVHAGPGAEVTGSVNDVWSHAWVTNAPVATNDKTQSGATVYVYRYIMLAEDSPMGVFGHEFGHTLGLPDLYDYDGSSAGVGAWDMMGYGSWNDNGDTPAQPGAWCKIRADWITPTTVLGTQALEVPPAETSATSYKLVAASGAPDPEYFLVENRAGLGFDSALPSHGLLVWHIDDAITSNDDENHPHVALEQADGRTDLEAWVNSGDAGDPFPGATDNRTFDDYSAPGSKTYAGTSSGVAVTSVGDAGSPMHATLTGGGDIPPHVAITVPADGATVSGDVTLVASASDDLGVDNVEFFADGVMIGSGAQDGDLWSIAWDSAGMVDGYHVISAIATDTSDQTGSDAVTLRVDNYNDPPVADAGPEQVVTDADGDGTQAVTLDARGGGSIAFDAASSARTPVGDASSLSWSHTTSGELLIMLVGVTMRSNRTVVSLTYDGVGLTRIRHDNPGIDVSTELWYLIAPHVGTHTVSMTTNTATTIEAGATTWTGVGQTVETALGNQTGAGGTGTTATLRIASAGGELVVDVIGTQNVGATVAAAQGQTERWNMVGYWGNGAASSKPGALDVSMSWGLAVRESWAMSAIALKPAGGSYDPDGTITRYSWDVGCDESEDLVGETVAASFPLGTTSVCLTVTDDDGATAAATTAVTVNEGSGASTVHVGDLDATKKLIPGKNQWQVTVTATVHDQGHAIVPGALVSGAWTGAYAGPVSGTTNSAGAVAFSTPKMTSGTQLVFTVNGVTHQLHAYAAAQNHDPDGDSDGTSIAVIR